MTGICGCGRLLPHQGMCAAKWRARGGYPKRGMLHRRQPKRRFLEHFSIGKALVLALDNPAVVEGRTIFPTRVFASDVQDRLLKSGEHQRKIGDRVTKGELAGAPIYTLTLEERATCPRDCAMWRSCYGNAMPWSRRIAHDDTLMDRLALELADLLAKYERILVRLHILGDFYSVAYVHFWQAMLKQHQGLHIFGYTARHEGAIGREVAKLARQPRCWIRRSDGGEDEFRTIVVSDADQATAAGAIVCPAQTGRTACCGTCALCWATPKTIAFLKH